MAQALVLFIPRTQYCCFMTLDIKSVPWLVSILPDTPTRENNWIKAVATCGVSCVFGETFLGVGSQKLHRLKETLLCPGLRTRCLFSGKGVKHLQLPFFSSAQGRI